MPPQMRDFHAGLWVSQICTRIQTTLHSSFRWSECSRLSRTGTVELHLLSHLASAQSRRSSSAVSLRWGGERCTQLRGTGLAWFTLSCSLAQTVVLACSTSWSARISVKAGPQLRVCSSEALQSLSQLPSHTDTESSRRQHTKTNRHSCVPINLYLQKQGRGPPHLQKFTPFVTTF